MSAAKEKKPKKGSLAAMLPDKVTFKLKSFGDREFAFRKITLADEAWVEKTFEMTLDAFIASLSRREVATSELCRLWFYFIEDVKGLEPYRTKEVDRETGEEKEVLVTGSRLLMQSIAGLPECLEVNAAFFRAYANSRPLEDMPEWFKKKIAEIQEPKQTADESPTR